MDLEREILSVLDNPSEVWASVVHHLSTPSKTLLLVMTSCKAPLTLTDWQAAVARVSTDAAVSFNGALKSLDDTFVSLNRDKSGRDVASFRNPSMDDFCAENLNSNVGFALAIATHQPSYTQVVRLIELATARKALSRRKYPALYESLVSEPTLILNRLLDLISAAPKNSGRARPMIGTLFMLIGSSRGLSPTDRSRVRQELGAAIEAITFANANLAYLLFDSEVRTRGVMRVLGAKEFEELYERLWHSADELNHFDTMANLDGHLKIEGSTTEWREHFESFNDDWNPESFDGGSSVDADSMRGLYNTVAEHLGSLEVNFSEDWDGLVERIEEEERARREQDEDYEEPDETWLSSPNNSTSTSSGGSNSYESDSRGDPIDAMFASLIDESADDESP